LKLRLHWNHVGDLYRLSRLADNTKKLVSNRQLLLYALKEIAGRLAIAINFASLPQYVQSRVIIKLNRKARGREEEIIADGRRESEITDRI
jgi:hypothetical protein